MTYSKNTNSEVMRFRMDFRKQELSRSDCRRLFHIGVLFLGIVLMGAAYGASQALQKYEIYALQNQEIRGSIQ